MASLLLLHASFLAWPSDVVLGLLDSRYFMRPVFFIRFPAYQLLRPFIMDHVRIRAFLHSFINTSFHNKIQWFTLLKMKRKVRQNVAKLTTTYVEWYVG